MDKIRVLLAAAIFLLSAPVAFASGSSGLLTLGVGIPLLTVVSAGLLLMLLIRPRKTV